MSAKEATFINKFPQQFISSQEQELQSADTPNMMKITVLKCPKINCWVSKVPNTVRWVISLSVMGFSPCDLGSCHNRERPYIKAINLPSHTIIILEEKTLWEVKEGEIDKVRPHTLYPTYDVDPLSPPLMLLLISTIIKLHQNTNSMLQQGSYIFKSYI